ncbi:MAG: DNA topoisomerase I [Gammaproteobacteria bacterium]|nr:DNA topoisomerase I [Gammaproteobacteria bacterium]
MGNKLVVVESPAKASTIGKYLGPEFQVLASYGHVRDLVAREGAVDTAGGFEMRYEPIEKNKRHVDAIARAMKKADTLYLATDPDREGEAISWHLHELLAEGGLLKNKDVHRVVFYEVTRQAVQDAVAHPRDLAMPLVNAQQARRALDYLVGFNLSPLLWKKIRRGLSAGRVQSPALRLIVERELEIEAFQQEEYWTVEADARAEGGELLARLTEWQGEKLGQFSIRTAAEAKRVQKGLLAAAGGRLTVRSVERKERRRTPAPPFTTSTLQQEAVRKLGFSAQRAMRTAQQLYEGVDTGGGRVGLITYMRTDSVTLAREALEEIRGLIAERYGVDKLPDRARVYTNRSKNAQEAHEAVRPTSVSRRPEELAAHLSRDQLRLYELIWRRTVACQMTPAVFHTVGVDLACGTGNTFRATGSTVADPGFMAVYREGGDERTEDDEERRLPPLEEGQVVELLEVRPEQHFTEPPPRYTEASLVKALEEYGIGRPSTYASIISTLQQREYAELESRRFRPTDIGRIVNRFLTEHFSRYVDYDFTARLEDDLDSISRGEREWVPLLREFWKEFEGQVKEKDAAVSRRDLAQVRELGADPASGRPVTVRMGRYGPFAQIGTPEDEEKPRFAGLRPGQRLDTISLEEALTLFHLPRELGVTPEGEPVSVNVGRFGPYVKFGGSFASLKPGDDPYTVSLERALELIVAKREADAAREIRRFEGTGVRVLKGRFGPYVTDGKRNGRIPKDRDPASLTLEECEKFLAEAPIGKPGRKGRAPAKAAKAPKAARAPKAAKTPKAPKGSTASGAAAPKPRKAAKAPKAPAARPGPRRAKKEG